jgi:hypothetical protein
MAALSQMTQCLGATIGEHFDLAEVEGLFFRLIRRNFR